MNLKITLWLTFSLAGVWTGLVATAQDLPTNPNGTWTWSKTGWDPANAKTRETKYTLELKTASNRLTGKLGSLTAQPGREDREGEEKPVENGKIEGSKLSFDIISLTWDGASYTIRYTNHFEGVVSGDTIKGSELIGHGGQAWVATRSHPADAASPAVPGTNKPVQPPH